MPATGAERDEKALLRDEIRRGMQALPLAVRRASDRVLFARFLALPQVQRAGCLFLFYGQGGEPETALLLRALWAAGKGTALPRCLPDRRMEARLVTGKSALLPGPFSIPEPGDACPVLAPSELDLALVPALCYDRGGYRLGRGGGYYDRWLPGFSGFTVGLCRDLFLRERLPRRAHDRAVELVLTETAETGRALPRPHREEI